MVAFWVHAWQRVSLPRFRQLDNDVLFGNSGRWPRSLNPVMRLALRAGVQVVFIPFSGPSASQSALWGYSGAGRGRRSSNFQPEADRYTTLALRLGNPYGEYAGLGLIAPGHTLTWTCEIMSAFERRAGQSGPAIDPRSC